MNTALQTPNYLTQAPVQGKTFFFNQEAAHYAKVQKAMPIIEQKLMEYYRKNSTKHSLHHKDSVYGKEKHDITNHVWADSETGVFREEKDFGFILLNEAIKSDLFDSLFHL